MAPTAPGETARCGLVLGPEPLRPRCRPVWFPSSPPSCLLETAKSRTLCPLWVCPLLGELPAPRVHLALSTSIPPGRMGSPKPHTPAASAPALHTSAQNPSPGPARKNQMFLYYASSFLSSCWAQIAICARGREGDGGLNWGAEQLWQETSSPPLPCPRPQPLTL